MFVDFEEELKINQNILYYSKIMGNYLVILAEQLKLFYIMMFM